jgi:aminopeptidase N
MLRFFEARAGVPFPQAVYTQVLVPGSAAQEKSSFSLLGQDELDPILVDATEDWAIAHELAHQWWGNLVTCRTWSHFWLNESLATFMVAAWKEERWGRAAYQHELDLFRKRHARAIDAGFDVPLAYSGTYPSLGIRRAIQYSKGALFLHLLRQELGEDVFWSGLRQFTSEHAGGAVVSSDFQSAMQRASGKDLGPLFRTWVHDSFHRGESVRRQK